ncbi:TRAP transporter fused permease subunit [Desulfobacula sp.]|uniref:TRAP transporter permease n=1 Tax=Desulfobacula sp. TaxID=2593537 RepID=UPI0026252E35|nr:TRAP transporter fused permease subunit [Desulfobacula sp.]
MSVTKAKMVDLLIIGLTFFLVIFQMISSQVYLLSTIPYLNLHIAFCILITIIHHYKSQKEKAGQIWSIIVSIICIVVFGYVQIFWEDIQLRAYFNSNLDLCMGILLIFLALESTRMGLGSFLPIISIIFILYGFVGEYLPEPLTCQSMIFSQAIANLSVGFEGGVYAFLHISANFLFLFILFGGVLNATGASKLFIMLGRLVMNKVRGGAAMMAVIASAGVGSITGSAAANVAVTGPITIPLMKKTGFKPHEAGGVEAAASNGGQIMPPIMGMVAFAMSGLTGIPYLQIVTMAILPSVLYFFTLGLYVYFVACKRNLTVADEEPEETMESKEWMFATFNFLSPIIVIITLLLMGYSINFVGFWAIVTVLIVSLIRGKTRPSLSAFVDGFVKGTQSAAAIGASTACVGLILSTLNMSGIGVKFVLGIVAWSHGILIVALLLIFVVSVILGMGGASITAYIMVAVFTVPALMKMGVTFEQGHFFAMFVAVFAFLTPPIAIVSLIAAKVANANYIKTAIESTKAAMGGFLLPFLFIYCPLLLLQPQNLFIESFGLVACVVLLICFESSMIGYFLECSTPMERIAQVLSGLSMALFITTSTFVFFILGTILFIGVTLIQIRKKRLFNYKPIEEG